MFEVYAAASDAEVMDRSQTFPTQAQALEYYSYLKANPGLLNGSGFDLYLTDLESDDEVISEYIPPS